MRPLDPPPEHSRGDRLVVPRCRDRNRRRVIPPRRRDRRCPRTEWRERVRLARFSTRRLFTCGRVVSAYGSQRARAQRVDVGAVPRSPRSGRAPNPWRHGRGRCGTRRRPGRRGRSERRASSRTQSPVPAGDPTQTTCGWWGSSTTLARWWWRTRRFRRRLDPPTPLWKECDSTPSVEAGQTRVAEQAHALGAGGGTGTEPASRRRSSTSSRRSAGPSPARRRRGRWRRVLPR